MTMNESANPMPEALENLKKILARVARAHPKDLELARAGLFDSQVQLNDEQLTLRINLGKARAEIQSVAQAYSDAERAADLLRAQPLPDIEALRSGHSKTAGLHQQFIDDEAKLKGLLSAARADKGSAEKAFRAVQKKLGLDTPAAMKSILDREAELDLELSEIREKLAQITRAKDALDRATKTLGEIAAQEDQLQAKRADLVKSMEETLAKVDADIAAAEQKHAELDLAIRRAYLLRSQVAQMDMLWDSVFLAARSPALATGIG